MKELAIFIDINSKKPVYEQIYSFIRNEITTGKLNAGEKLPSTRGLADYLQCSRSTVLMAYEQLIAEGYIETRPKRGYFVMELEKSFRSGTGIKENKSCEESGQEYEIDFSPVGVDADNFPFNEWRKISRQVFLPENADLFNSGDARGDMNLRKSIADYLNNSRGVKADPDRIILGAGYESLLMILDIILDKNCIFAMENPVYPKAYKLITSFGREVCPVELDDKGIDVAKLNETQARVVYVTPSHQYPMGVVMSVKRRQELLSWSETAEERYIIEDDYDSEFRYKGKPIPSLQGMDSNNKVIYIGTFSKAISPAIRMSYMVLPEALYHRYMETGKFYSNTVSRIDQKMVELFVESGGFERHLGRMRTTYKNKHAYMLNRLKSWHNVEISGENAGAHMLVWFNDKRNDRELIELAAKWGVKVYSLKECYIPGSITSQPDNVVILGYAKLNEEEIERGLVLLEEAWGIM